MLLVVVVVSLAGKKKKEKFLAFDQQLISKSSLGPHSSIKWPKKCHILIVNETFQSSGHHSVQM